MLKISAFYYFKIENGKRKLDYKMAVKIASIFNLTPDDIFYKFLRNIKLGLNVLKKLTVISYISM